MLHWDIIILSTIYYAIKIYYTESFRLLLFFNIIEYIFKNCIQLFNRIVYNMYKYKNRDRHARK